MSLIEIQQFTARLFTDKTFLILFTKCPDKTFKDYHLTNKEKNFLLLLNTKDLFTFSKIIEKNRFRKIEFAFPVSLRLFGEVMKALHHRFYLIHPVIPKIYAEEIRDFGDYFAELIYNIKEIPPYASDLFKYELLHYLVVYSKKEHFFPSMNLTKLWMKSKYFIVPNAEIAKFYYNPIKIIEAVQQNQPPLVVQDDVWLFFQKIMGKNAVKVFQVSETTARLILFCREGILGKDICKLFSQVSSKNIKDILQSLLEKRIIYFI